MPSAAFRNIQTIAEMEEAYLERRSLVDRIADSIAAFSGSMTFVLLHLSGFVAWFLINLGLIPGLRPFDPFPFVLLAMAVSCEAVLLSTFVLMKQNRMSKRGEDRDQLHLQIALLTEREVTKLLQIQQRMATHMGVRQQVFDNEAVELSCETAVDNLAKELREKLPDEAA